jgi:flagellar hook assembly protein FlgD
MAVLRASALVLVAAALVPSAASAADRFVVRDEPVDVALRATRDVSVRQLRRDFDLVGLHWKGSGTVWFQTLSSTGSWSGWRAAAPEPEDSPDLGSEEAASRRGWKFGSPYWTGRATSIRYRLEGRVSRLRAYFIWTDPGGRPARMPTPLAARAAQPTIVTRSEWGADESIVRAPPYYAPAVHFAVVHHTAGTNSYSASESAAIVRGIERYHVLANGWNDIGYNFLVDKYGQVFEGRGGGIARNVVGAHAQGFNTGSTGVAVLGTYESQKVSPAARVALVKLLAWRLDVAHVDPLSRLRWVSGGNAKYPAGTTVSLRAVSGHRDTGPTSCPGSSLYAQLPGIAADVAATGLPKLYKPVVSGSLGGPVRFTATLTEPLAWTVAVRDDTGAVVAGGNGSGETVDWAWDASAIPFGAYTYRIVAGPDVLPAGGRVPGPPPLEITSFKARPHVLTPNNDGVGEATTISYSLSTRATVRVEVLDSSAHVVRSLANGQVYRSGAPSFLWNGRTSSGKLVRDGRYRVRLTASSPGQEASKSRTIVVDRTLGHLAVAPTPFSPNKDGRLDWAVVSFRLARQADVRVRIMDGERAVAVLHPVGTLAAGAAEFSWDGEGKGGVRVADGLYRAFVEATTTLGTRTLRLPLIVDTRAPVVRVLSARLKDGRSHVRLWLSEAATLRVRYGSPLGGASRFVDRPAGYSRLSLPRATRVRLQGTDAAANVGARVIARVTR